MERRFGLRRKGTKAVADLSFENREERKSQRGKGVGNIRGGEKPEKGFIKRVEKEGLVFSHYNRSWEKEGGERGIEDGEVSLLCESGKKRKISTGQFTNSSLKVEEKRRLEEASRDAVVEAALRGGVGLSKFNLQAREESRLRRSRKTVRGVRVWEPKVSGDGIDKKRRKKAVFQ